jgi:hypothetical protein
LHHRAATTHGVTSRQDRPPQPLTGRFTPASQSYRVFLSIACHTSDPMHGNSQHIKRVSLDFCPTRALSSFTPPLPQTDACSLAFTRTRAAATQCAEGATTGRWCEILSINSQQVAEQSHLSRAVRHVHPASQPAQSLASEVTCFSSPLLSFQLLGMLSSRSASLHTHTRPHKTAQQLNEPLW